MPNTATDLKQHLMVQERAYLDAVQSRDGDTIARLTAPTSLIVSAQGGMLVERAAVREMVARHDASRRYEIDDTSVQVLPVTDDVAIVSYKLRTVLPGDGGSTEAFDTDVWVRRDGAWACALHVETPTEG